MNHFSNVIKSDLSKALRWLLKATLRCFMLLFAMGLGQLIQGFVSTEELRMNAINEWTIIHPEQKSLVEKLESCQRTPIDNESMLPEMLTLKECGLKLHAEELVSFIEKNVNQLSKPAWPLSLINNW